MKILFSALHFLFKQLFPPYCCYCKKDGSLLCEVCYEHIIFLPIPPRIYLKNVYLDSVLAATQYTDITKSLLVAMKYKHVKDVGVLLGRLLYHTMNFNNCNYITYVPMHSNKKNMRGYNQAEVIAEELSRLSNIPCLSLLNKNVETISQASVKDRNIRSKNAAHVYSFNKIYSEKIIKKSVVIIDDVLTTGNTLNECAKVLKQAQVSVVHGLVVTHKTT